MSNPLLRHTSRGNQSDYILGTVVPFGYDAFDVVRFHSREAISEPFQCEITLARAAGEGAIPLEALVDMPATFGISTEGRWRLIHGIIAEACCLEQTSELLLYRVLLVPHWWRARHRQHCRNFVDQSLHDILSGVLENRGPLGPLGTLAGGLVPLPPGPLPPADLAFFDNAFVPPLGCYRWQVIDQSRLRDPKLRNYVVQYNESDFDFVSRLLEEEGLSYFFEHGPGMLVMTITDRPGGLPLIPHDEKFTLRNEVRGGGGDATREVLQSFSPSRRLRSQQVVMRDFDWPRSRTLLEASAGPPTPSGEYFEYPARDEAIDAAPCANPARIRWERFEVERQLSSGSGTVRTMEPGNRFALEDDGGLLDLLKDYLAVAVETYASQLEVPDTLVSRERFGFDGGLPSTPSYEVRFQALSSLIQYRPLQTPHPRIDGIQTALVTAEEIPEADRPPVNANASAQVRVRFAWDQTLDDGTPSSCWIRVNQLWAGGAYGILFHPRVGHEVLVSYLQGDPERPMVVGGVYNAQTPPPYDGAAEPLTSTVKTETPNTGGFNELRFHDVANEEEIYLHAEKDHNEQINHDHNTNMGHDEMITVGNDQTISVGNDQSTTVMHDQLANVINDKTTTVCRDRFDHTQRDQTSTVDRDQASTVYHDRSITVGNDDSLEVTANRSINVGEDVQLEVAGSRSTQVEGDDTLTVNGTCKICVGGSMVEIKDGEITITTGDATVHLNGDTLELLATTLNAHASAVCDIKGEPIKLNCS